MYYLKTYVVLVYKQQTIDFKTIIYCKHIATTKYIDKVNNHMHYICT